MGILSWIVVGGLAGAIAGIITGKKHGLISKIIIGILGANIGGFIASRFDLGKVDGINLSRILISAGGACLLLAFLNLVRGKDGPGRTAERGREAAQASGTMKKCPTFKLIISVTSFIL